jgi:glycosyltransferase involved in cell wall biosynthesis
MITTFYPPYNFGGDGYAVQRLTHALARRGHSVTVIHDADAFRSLSTGPEPAPLAAPSGVTVHRLESRAAKLSCLATQQSGRPLVHGRTIRRILGSGFDVIHFHNISLVGGPGVLGYGSGIKLYTAHEHWLVCPTHVLWRHNREVCTGRECLRCVLHYRRPPQLWRSGSLLERESAHVDEFLTLSHFAASKHAEFGFSRPLTVIPAFLPDDEGTSREAQEPPVVPYFLFVGRLSQIKGLQDLIPFFTGEGTAELWVAGSGEYEPELRALAEDGPRIRFLGQLSPDALRPLYQHALAVVVPSACYEVFPMVVLEAFREGTPIIARALGPFPEIVAASQGGMLFQTQDELGSALVALTDDPELRTRLGAAGRAAFESRWSEAVALGSYFDVIEGVAKRRGIDLTIPDHA